MPMLGFISNFGYLLVSVVWGLMVTRRVIPIGDVQAFIQYARHFNQPIAQLATIANVIQSTIASAERVFELLAEEEMTPDPPTCRRRRRPRGTCVFENVYFGYSPDQPLYEGLNLGWSPGRWWPSSAPPARARRPWSTC